MREKKWPVYLLFFLLFVCVIYRSSVFRITKNFYEVDPGKFYRSAQLTPTELEDVIDQYHIKTVVSLRGAPKNSFWFPRQVEVLSRKKVKFVTVGWTSDYFPHEDDLRAFVQTLQGTEYPILVHCRTGADRTGEATAIYAMEQMHESKELAIEKHMGFKYWHVPSFHPAKIEFVRRWQGYKWALEDYKMCALENKRWAEPGHCP